MARSWLGIPVLLLGAIVGCEDGPSQTFQSAGPGSGDWWNDGKNTGSNDPSKQGFKGELGGTNKVVLCTAPQQKAALAKAFVQPIEPPRRGGGLDLAGSDMWEGLTVEEAENKLCQAVEYDADTIYWGDNAEIVSYFTPSTRKLYYLGFNLGYNGKIEFKSRDGKDTFVMALGANIKKNGSNYVITWDNNAQTGEQIWTNELTDGLFATFAPGLPPETNCLQSGHCVRGNFGDQGYLYIPPIGFAFRVANIYATQPTPSTTYYFDQYLARTLPFSFANPVMKAGVAGPQAQLFGLGPQNKTCTVKLGLTYGELLSNCVEVSGNAQTDALEKTKMLSGVSHGSETIGFADAAGIDLTFAYSTLKADDVVRDMDRPQPSDPMIRFRVDQSTLGAFTNDFLDNDPLKAKDLHMMGLVYAEFARSVQEHLNAFLPLAKRHQLGDPACLTGDLDKFPPADGCTGFEGFMVPLAPSKISDPNLKKLATDPLLFPNDQRTLPLRRGIKPGHQNVVFCDGPNLTACGVDATTVGDTFPIAYARLLKIHGKGNTANLPPDAQDARFLWREWARAVFKYFLVEDGTGTATHDTVKNAPYYLIRENFDEVGGGQFEDAEYIDRSGTIPLEISMVADVRNGIFSDFTMTRYNFRGETALYQSTLENRSDPPGKEDFLISNIFGAPAIKNFYADTQSATAYECAIGAKTVNQCNGQEPPKDPLGNIYKDDFNRPLLTGYPGVFTTSGTIFRLGAYTPVSVKQTYPLIQSAMFTFPQKTNPYDTASSPDNPATRDFLLPWTKKQPGVGFHIPINGQQDRFISGFDVDFTATTIFGDMIYDYVDPKNPSKGIHWEATRSEDFLGDVFMCVDPKTKDLLKVEMFTPTLDVLDWLYGHPSSLQACGIIVRWTSYSNYVLFISSLVNGARVHATQGGGWGRINQVELWDPSL